MLSEPGTGSSSPYSSTLPSNEVRAPESTSTSRRSPSGSSPKDQVGGGTTSRVVGPKYDGATLSRAWKRATSQKARTASSRGSVSGTVIAPG